MNEKIKEYTEKIKLKEARLVSSYQEGYLGKNVYLVTLNDGTTREIEQLTKNHIDGDAVVIMPITKDNRVIIEVQSRPNLIDNEGVTIEFPAGMVDVNEEYTEAARRELLEETGYIAEDVEELEWHYQDQGCSNAIIKTFLATGCEKKDIQHLDDDEVLQPLEITMEELIDLYKNGRINDASSKLAILSYLTKKKGL